MRRLARMLYIGADTFLWGVLACLALETCETGRAFVAERAYESFFNEQNAKVYRMAPVEELAMPVNQFMLPPGEAGTLELGESAVPVALPEEASPEVPPEVLIPYTARDLPEEIRLQRGAFAAQSPANREVIATLQGEFVATFTPEGEYVSSYGEPLLGQHFLPYLSGREEVALARGVAQARAAVARAESVERYEFTFIEYVLTHYCEALVVPRRNDAGITETVDIILRDGEKGVGAMGAAIPAKSNWEIPQYRYKRSWYEPYAITTTNAHGFRDDEVTVPKPAGVIRIVCVGGSTTEEGNSNESTYPNIMERKLRERFGERIEVVNCGICGLNSYYERRRVYDYLDLEPDLILYYNAINDICHRHIKTWLEDEEDWKQWVACSHFAKRYFNRYLLPSDEEITEHLRRTSLLNLRAIHYAAAERGMDMAICSFAYPAVPFWHIRDRNYLDMNMREAWSAGDLTFATYCHVVDLYNGALKEMCREEGMLYIPAAEHFLRGLDHFYDACHMTPVGLEFKANLIGAYVQEYLERRHGLRAGA